MVQAHQLLRGGREPSLQTQSLFGALETLVELSIMEPGTARRLREDYSFLRRLENAIQALHDQQTHMLPSGEDLQRIAKAMRLTDAKGLQRALDDVRRQVDELFRSHLQTPEQAPSDDIWSDHWRSLKDSSGERTEADSALGKFLERLGRQSLSQRAAQRLDRFMPLLLERLDRRQLAPEALTDVLELVLAR
jgi:glutamate-ammonia-ligase adenylyltransferase